MDNLINIKIVSDSGIILEYFKDYVDKKGYEIHKSFNYNDVNFFPPKNKMPEVFKDIFVLGNEYDVRVEYDERNDFYYFVFYGKY